jgi:hypothetical protein
MGQGIDYMGGLVAVIKDGRSSYFRLDHRAQWEKNPYGNPGVILRWHECIRQSEVMRVR